MRVPSVIVLKKYVGRAGKGKQAAERPKDDDDALLEGKGWGVGVVHCIALCLRRRVVVHIGRARCSCGALNSTVRRV